MDEIELIKQRINIVDLIQEYLPLKKAGVNFKANCPFHQEKSPSFMVSPERGIWHCFGGCQKGGDIFKFVMEKEGVEFKEALEVLAKRAGVVLSNQGKKTTDYKQRIFEVNEKAAQFFHYILTAHPLGKNALEYLIKRGLTQNTIKVFNLGYAPLSWDSLNKFLKKRGFSQKEQTDAGLTIPSPQGGYDRFRGRVMFPLLDVQGRILGFAGRVLAKGEPKYINTPQTIVFDKSKFLFGINLSKGEIRQKKAAILAEGEMDMIMSYQSGIKNIVASKGTALTISQIELLQRYTDSLALCFDTDLAGDAASRRGIELADRAGLNLKVVRLENAKDPAETCLKDPNKWEKAVTESIPIYDYYLESVSKRFDPDTAFGKRQIFLEILPIWQKITDQLVKEHYIQKLAALLEVKDELIRKELQKTSLAEKPMVRNIDSFKKDDKVAIKDRRKLLEEYLLSLILHIPDESTFVPNFPETLFTEETLRQIYVLLVLYLDTISFQGKSFKIAEFVLGIPPELVDTIDRLYLLQIDDKLLSCSNWEKEIANVVTELKKILIKASLEKLSLQIKKAQEFDKMELLQSLNRRFRDLSIKLKNL